MHPLHVWAVVTVLVLGTADPASAQGRPWHIDIGVGQTTLVDDSTKRYLMLTGSLRRSLTPRVSVGPELVVMGNSTFVTDRIVMLTGNVTFDLVAGDGTAHRFVPFLIGGAGLFFGRDVVRNGPYWHREPAFIIGAGVRARVGEMLSVGVEYRFGWELHQRIGGVCTVTW